MTNKTPSGARRYREGTKPGTCKQTKCFSFFFFLLLSSDGLAQYCHNIWRWWNSSILHRTVHSPIAFFTTLSTLTKRSKDAQSKYGIVGMPFCHCVYACAQNHHIATSLRLSDLQWPNDRVTLRVDVLCQRFVTLLPSYLCCLAAVVTATMNRFAR